MTEHIALVHSLLLFKMERGDLSLDSKEALKSTLDEFEIHIKSIEHQLEICKKDHSELRNEITRLVEENRVLMERLKTSVEKEINYGEKYSSSEKSTAVENLQQQLALAIEEKQTIERLWKSSLAEVEVLHDKLQEYKSGEHLTKVQSKLNDVQKDYTEAIQILESRLSVLKKENDQLSAKAQLLERQLAQVTGQMAIITEKNLVLNTSLKEASEQHLEWKSRYLSLEAKYIEMDRMKQLDKVKLTNVHEYEKIEAALKEKLDITLRQREELQTALERCHERTAQMLRSAASDRSRIQEAVALVETAMQERDDALAAQALSIAEVKRLKGELNRLIEAAGQRVGEEAATIKQQFDNQLTELRDQLRVSEQERNRKIIEVQQLQRESERLQGMLSQNQKHAPSRDKQLDNMYQQLQRSEAECLQLRMEHDSLQDALHRLQDKCQKNNREKVKLKHEMQMVKQQCQLYQHELDATHQRADLLNEQLHHANVELAQLQSDILLAKEHWVNTDAKVRVADTIEIYRKLDSSYSQMNDKWKNEMNTVTDKFEAKLKKVKAKSKSSLQKEEINEVNIGTEMK